MIKISFLKAFLQYTVCICSIAHKLPAILFNISSVYIEEKLGGENEVIHLMSTKEMYF